MLQPFYLYLEVLVEAFFQNLGLEDDRFFNGVIVSGVQSYNLLLVLRIQIKVLNWLLNLSSLVLHDLLPKTHCSLEKLARVILVLGGSYHVFGVLNLCLKKDVVFDHLLVKMIINYNLEPIIDTTKRIHNGFLITLGSSCIMMWIIRQHPTNYIDQLMYSLL